MLLVGTANPRGEINTYNGLWYTSDELSSLVQSGSLHGIPVKAEHTGSNVGTVVSSFLDDSGALQCVIDVSENSVEGAITSGLIRDGIAADLSLGYTVDVAHSDTEKKLKAGEKRLLEVSIVRKGAREKCQIHAIEEEGKGLRFLQSSDPWAAFNL
tara:strand:+ start:2874 stop:3341 length:468 start_codon:yes stop_codon:yes gene_type:complete